MTRWAVIFWQYCSLVALRVGSWRRWFWRVQYNRVGGMFGSGVAFMNIGYAHPSLPETSDSQQLSANLYQKLVPAGALTGVKVLEVSCGMGGGAALLVQRDKPAHYTAVDLSPVLIARNQQVFDHQNLCFMVDDALNLSAENDSVDAVVNVEASHAYASRSRFFAEAWRVLRPGGILYYADYYSLFLDHSTKRSVERAWQRAGFELVHTEDLRPGVLLSRQWLAQNKGPLYGYEKLLEPEWAAYAPALKRAVDDLAMTPNSLPYKLMHRGWIGYGMWVLRKE